MEAAVKARAAAKSWLARAEKSLKTGLDRVRSVGEDRRDTVITELRFLIDQFELRLESFDKAQSTVELAIDLEADLEADIQQSADFRDIKTVSLIEAKTVIQGIMDHQDAGSSESVNSYGSHQSRANGVAGPTSGQARLPKLELPKFGGDVTLWQAFWDKFNAIIHDSSQSNVSKFTYLQSLLCGEALASIKGLSLTADNYDIARAILEQRFGRKERIIFGHLQEMLTVSQSSTTQDSLWQLYDRIQTHVRCLENLDVGGDRYGVVLTPMVLHQLPPSIRLEWARVGEGHEGDLEFLLKFLFDEIRRRERSLTFSNLSSPAESTEKKGNPPNRKPRSTASALLNHTGNTRRCVFCDGQHFPDQCGGIKGLSVGDLKEKVKKMGLCFKCLRGSHLARSCNKKCFTCQGPHHKVLCLKGVERVERVQGSATESGCKCTLREGHGAPCVDQDSHPTQVGVIYAHSKALGTTTVMQTVHTKFGNQEVAVLFDSGSDRSFITSKCVQRLNLEFVDREFVSYASFGNDKASKGKRCNIWKLTIGDNRWLTLTEIPQICMNMVRSPIPEEFLAPFKDVVFQEDYSRRKDINVDILIGIDLFWSLMREGRVISSSGLVAQETEFGWMLSGAWRGPERLNSRFHQFLCVNQISENTVRRFWELESVGISVSEQSKVLEDFCGSIEKRHDRYSVGLPWKSDEVKQKLQNNEGLARKRLSSLMKKLEADPTLKERYNAVLAEMEASGVAVEVPPSEIKSSNPVFYLPHRPVVKESSMTTKVRPVFDASAASYNGLSLNDCLKTGPCLLPNLVAILLRFRRWRVAFTADIVKAFFQIGIHEGDQDVHRFLWDVGDRVKIMKIVRAPFGNKSSPFILNATVRHHLSTMAQSRCVMELQENMYVDDLLTGADSAEEANSMMKEAIEVMNKAGMSLAKWNSNLSKSSKEMEFSKIETKISEGDSTKVLGLKWIPEADCFSFDGVQLPNGLVLTKRVVLGCIARLFDPLGLLTPFSMSAKILFQDLWQEGLEWDEEIPESFQARFQRWLGGIQEIRSWRIPRCYVKRTWTGIESPEVYVFCDASEKAYGCSVYLRVVENEQASVSLVLSRARVAPLKKITLPRLELMAALLGARLVKFVLESLGLPANTVYHCYSDSMVTLGWIRSDASKWNVFVSNRVREIHELTDPSLWSHCSGDENPADLVTRGISASSLVSSQLWLEGPSWLKSGYLEETNRADGDRLVDDLQMLEQSQPSVLVSPGGDEDFIPFERWGSLSKTVRIVGWIRRFIGNIRKHSRRSFKDLQMEELKDAQKRVIQLFQNRYYPVELQCLRQGRPVGKTSSLKKLNPFLDEEGIIRLKGRLQFSDLSFDERHPILIPKSHFALILIRSEHIRLKHAGVKQLVSFLRNTYWIVGLRSMARRVKRECFSCQRIDAGHCDEPSAPLPEQRAKKSPPFSVTGLDFAGPLFCADEKGNKFYILLFTCGVTRAVHLELVPSMSTDDFLLAFRRFVSRRGMPASVFSDNAKTFRRAPSQIGRIFEVGCPSWQYIAPRSPWWGGWWERLVRSVKSALKKSIGQNSLIKTELETLLVEIEGCLNSRPLTFVGGELEEKEVLTPAHFLIGRGCHLLPGNAPEGPLDANGLGEKYLFERALLDRFWKIWSRDYLRNLPGVRSSIKKGSIGEGSVVLVREDNVPRLCWPIGVVKKLFPGRDGIVRSVEVRTKGGVLVRSIQRLHDLELSGNSNELGKSASGVTESHPETDTPEKSKDSKMTVEQSFSEGEKILGNCPLAARRSGPLSRTQDTGTRVSEKETVTRCGRRVRTRNILDM